jgi:hypothetical protein
MGRAGRLAGAIVAQTGSQYFLVGQTKEPCNFAEHGFEPPGRSLVEAPWFVRLGTTRAVTLAQPCLELAVEGEELALVLAHRFVIERNGSVSERLWRLVLAGGDPDSEVDPWQSPAGDESTGNVDARWLGAMPAPFWQIIRNTVLRCL